MSVTSPDVEVTANKDMLRFLCAKLKVQSKDARLEGGEVARLEGGGTTGLVLVIQNARAAEIAGRIVADFETK